MTPECSMDPYLSRYWLLLSSVTLCFPIILRIFRSYVLPRHLRSSLPKSFPTDPPLYTDPHVSYRILFRSRTVRFPYRTRFICPTLSRQTQIFFHLVSSIRNSIFYYHLSTRPYSSAFRNLWYRSSDPK